MTYLKNASAQWVATDSYLTGEFKVAKTCLFTNLYKKSSNSENRNAGKVYYYTAREGQETTKIYQEIKATSITKTGPTHDGRPCFVIR